MSRPEKPAHARQADQFLRVASQFRLGDLPTEQFHPLTADLSFLSRSNPGEALRILHQVDAAALDVLLGGLDRLRDLARRIAATLRAGRRIHLVGCGSTGRLSLACEALWRKTHRGSPLADAVTAFMAGGDAALVRAVEGFEDHAESGERQLLESRFRDGDLLIAATEGGETSFVIGAAELAAEISGNPPCFLFCNPEDILARTVSRSAGVLADARIGKICLPTGPMALSGSTRMQASTVLMAAVGHALLAWRDPDSLGASLHALAGFWKGLDTAFLIPFIQRESAAYAAGDLVDYVTDDDLAVSILTDTAERTPTFGFPSFGNVREGAADPSPCHLSLPAAPDSASAWESMLDRPPRGLEWSGLGKKASLYTLLGFDFSRPNLEMRRKLAGEGRHHAFDIRLAAGESGLAPMGLEFRLDGASHRLDTRGLPLLSVHLVLKMLLNAHSTLVMGRLGRFEGNVMTWVSPTNYKLIDRTVRYAERILQAAGISVPYPDLARACFALRDAAPGNKPMVHALADHFSHAGGAGGRKTGYRTSEKERIGNGNRMDGHQD